jgi:predicted transposase YbfD/YdcC
VLTVKENQPTLHAHLRERFDRPADELAADESIGFWQTDETHHGRREQRRCWTSDRVEDFPHHADWPQLRCFGVVEATRQVGNDVSMERRYFISSHNASAETLGQAVRVHWGIANSLHWVLDVAFREDDARVRVGHGPENLAVIRQLALSLLQQEKTAKVGIKNKRLMAGSDDTYLARVLSLAQL